MTFEQKPNPLGKITLRFGVGADPDKLGAVDRTAAVTKSIDEADSAHQLAEDTKREALEKFDAARWTYWEVVALVCYREPSRLLDLCRGLSRHHKLYDSPEYEADKFVRAAIQRGEITAFDASGNSVGPLAELGPDPSVCFSSEAIKAWTAPPRTRAVLNGDDLKREIRSALEYVIEQRRLSHPDDPLHGRGQVIEAMKILAKREISSERGGLRGLVQTIADAEFKKDRRPWGVRKKR